MIVLIESLTTLNSILSIKRLVKKEFAHTPSFGTPIAHYELLKIPKENQMKNLLLSLALLAPATLLANSLTPDLEQKFEDALDAQVSREYVSLTKSASIVINGKVKDLRGTISLEKKADEFSTHIGYSKNGNKMGFAIVRYLEETQEIKNQLVRDLKKAVLRTRHLQHDEKAVNKLLSSLRITPMIQLYETKFVDGSHRFSVNVLISAHGKKFCDYSDSTDQAYYSESMRDGIENSITRKCKRELKDVIMKKVKGIEESLSRTANDLALRNALKAENDKLRSALNNDGRESSGGKRDANKNQDSKSLSSSNQ